MSTAGAAVRAAAARPSTPAAEKADRARLGAVAIVSGVARLKYAGGEERSRISTRRSTGAPSARPRRSTSAFSWRGERPRAMLWVLKPGALLRGEQTPVTVRLDSDSVRLEAEGFGQLGRQAALSRGA